MKNIKKSYYQFLTLTVGFVLASVNLFAQERGGGGGLQGGAVATGIDAAREELATVGSSVADLMLPICLIMGFVGGIQCVSKFFNNDPDFKKSVINWGAAIVFAGVVGLVLNAAFG